MQKWCNSSKGQGWKFRQALVSDMTFISRWLALIQLSPKKLGICLLSRHPNIHPSKSSTTKLSQSSNQLQRVGGKLTESKQTNVAGKMLFRQHVLSLRRKKTCGSSDSRLRSGKAAASFQQKAHVLRKIVKSSSVFVGRSFHQDVKSTQSFISGELGRIKQTF